MTFLDEYRAGREADTTESGGASVLREWLTSQPDAVLEEVSTHDPAFTAAGMAFVTGHQHVLEVLDRNDVFSVSPYGEAMTRINRGPGFLLGMDDGPEYRQRLRSLAGAFRREDTERVRHAAAVRASEALTIGLRAGRLNLVDDFARLVPAQVVGDYFGVPGPSPSVLGRWARAIFTDAFVNVLGVPLLSRRAMRASAEFRRYLDRLILAAHEGRGSGVSPDHVLGRLLALQADGDSDLSDGRIRDDLLWCVAGTIDNVNGAVCRAMDRWLDDATLLHEAAAAARANDSARVQALVFETLRFRTPTPVVVRRCVRTHTLGTTGEGHQKTIEAGTLIFVGLGTAMMDATVIDAPKVFRPGRPDAHYLHFGAGVHHCLGKHVAVALVTGMVSALLRLPDLRRARGIAGRLRCVGPFPASLMLDLPSS